MTLRMSGPSPVCTIATDRKENPRSSIDAYSEFGRIAKGLAIALESGPARDVKCLDTAGYNGPTIVQISRHRLHRTQRAGVPQAAGVCGRSGLPERHVHRLPELIGELVELAVRDDVGRRDQHVIAAHAVERAAHGIAE